MRLVSPGGASVELGIVGYEQPPPEEPSGDGSGGDWLIVRGHCVDTSGTWGFEDAVLDTDDAADLHTWLGDVAAGSIEPSDMPGWGRHAIRFPEPELQLRLIGSAAGEYTLRLLLLGPVAPSWATENERGIEGYAVEVVMSDAEIRTEADVWRQQLDGFPRR